MSNIVEGIIEKVFKGEDKSTTYGDCANFTIFVNNTPYLTFTASNKADLFKVGDKVKFSYSQEIDKYSGQPVNKFKVKDNFENLSNPQLNTKKGFSGGTWKPRDPEEQIRIVNQSQLSNAVSILCHNYPETKILKVDVLRLASELVDWVYTNKPKNAGQPPQENHTKSENIPPDNYEVPVNQIEDDVLPF
jgi:hypothetical protein